MARPGSDIPERIIAAAREHFARSGVDAASLRKIAKDAGTSAPMISYHFENKDGLFRAVVDEVYDGFMADLEAAASETADPLERIEAIVRRVAGATPVERMTMRIVMREASVESDRLLYVAGRFLGGHGRLIREALTEAQEAGQVRPINQLAAVPALLAPVAISQLFRPIFEAVLGDQMDELFEQIIDIIFKGLLPR